VRTLPVLVLVLVLLGLGAACSSGPQPIDEAPHQQDILAWRATKDAMFKSNTDSDGDGQPDSPLMPELRAAFTGLPYYPIDEAYRMPAVLHENRTAPKLIIELPTSSTELRRMQRVGSLSFSLKGTPLSLTAFADEGDRVITRLFVPFGDLTSGTETYRGGRYLELERSSSGMYDLDFNRAYHPFCVFNAAYVCPVPPSENRLPVAIQAGERLPPAAGR
jgi:uncharacterized protein (DUF1684 family)